MTRIFVLIALVLINDSQQQQEQQQITTLFNCTFDSGFVDNCIFHGLIPPGDTLEIDTGQKSIHVPNRPLSDATSVFTPTMNGEMCHFPYPLGGQQMHFCHYDQNSTDYRCPTKSGFQSTCAQGQYGYKSTSSATGFLAIYKSNTTIVTNTSDERHCLTFYYYFTDRFHSPSISFRMHPSLNVTASQNIVTVNPDNENKWYYNQTTFTPTTNEYFLVFVLFRSQAFNDPSNFTFALDNISVINGTCDSVINASLTTQSSTSSEASSQATDVTTITIGTTVTEQTAMIIGKSSIFSEPTSRVVTNIMSSETMTTTFRTSTTRTATMAFITKGTTIVTSNIVATITADESIAGTPIMNSSIEGTNMMISDTTTVPTMNSTVMTTTTVISSTITTKSTNRSVIIGFSVGLGVPTLCTVIIIVIYIVKSKIQGCTFRI